MDQGVHILYVPYNMVPRRKWTPGLESKGVHFICVIEYKPCRKWIQGCVVDIIYS